MSNFKKRYIYFIVITFIIISCKNNNHSHSHESLADNHTHSNTDYFGAYTLNNKDYGTKTTVILENGYRKMKTNSLPNHKTGKFPTRGNPNKISEQNRQYMFPLNPKFVGKPTWVREPGIALNGVKFEPGTAEVVICETGENYRVEAFQDLINLGLDFNHAHVQPTGAYHYHGAPTSLIENFNKSKDLVHIGFAHDGFPIYYSKSGAYKSSYKLLDGKREGEDCTYTNPKTTINVNLDDNHDGTFGSDFIYEAGLGDLDECNGTTVNGKYVYLVTNEFPYVSRCLMGEYEEPKRDRRGGNRNKPITFEDLLERMDVNKDKKLSKSEVRGPLVNDFSKIDSNNDGFISIEELKKVTKRNRR
ncbi:MAG: YHYH protein [Polaribacter sp.]|uniref:YHYH protein n=1 Tax=Polaribacter sp. TaxID=1920175 RepID=UPI0032652C7E